MMNRRSFLNPHDNTLVEKIGRFIDELRPLDGERAADEGEVLARILARDKNESDRRLRLEILRTVGGRQPPPLPEGIDPEDLRQAVFRAAWETGAGIDEGNLFSADRNATIAAVAAKFGIDQDEVLPAMFSDTPAERRLVLPAPGEEGVARNAIRTINFDRLRRALRQGLRVTLRLPARTKGDASYVDLLWGLKRLGLMFEATEAGGSIVLDISGPYALFGKTTMYGNRLYDFCCLVLECAGKDWSLRIDLLANERGKKTRVANFWLDSSLSTHFIDDTLQPRRTMRSGDEEAFLKYFRKLTTQWTLDYEGAFVLLGEPGRQVVMVPDFVARGPQSRMEVFIEIVGFWRPEYLEKKIEKVSLLGDRRLILIINSKLSLSRVDVLVPGTDRVRVLFYKGREELKHVAEQVIEELAHLCSQ